jgi:hypothetical protein
LETQASVAKGAPSLYIANIIVLIANALYFLVLTNILRSTLDVGIVTALNIMIWLLATVCILAQPVTLQSPVPAPPTRTAALNPQIQPFQRRLKSTG